MKFFAAALSTASLATAAVLPEAEAKTNYDGYKLFKVDVPADANEGMASLYSLGSSLTDTIPLQGCSHEDHLDFAVPAHELDAFYALNLTSTLIEDDLGAAIAAEGPLVPYAGKQSSLPLTLFWSVFTDHS